MSTVTLSNPPALLRVPSQFRLPSGGIHIGRLLHHYGGGMIAALMLMIIVLSVMFAHLLTPYEPTAGMSLRDRYLPPMWEAGGSAAHPFGTDNLGRDVLARTLYGGRVSLGVASVATTLAMLIGAGIGLMSGYLGGAVDQLFVRLSNFWVSFPFLVLALAVIAVVGSAPALLIVLMALSGWVYPARVTRAQTLKVRQLDFVQSSVALGASTGHILRVHIIPAVISVNIVLWTLTFGSLILVESSLSFVGLGVNPPTPSWGNMLSDSKAYLQDAWWMSVFPGLALMLTILCVNTVGDALQKYMSRHLLD